MPLQNLRTGIYTCEGKDFTDNFALVIKDETFRIMLTLAELHGWKKYVIDVETAFLYGNLTEQIYMTAPIGYDQVIQALREDVIIPIDEEYDIGEDDILELLKTIYGLVKAAQEWYRRLKLKLLEIEYKQCMNDPCLFHHYNEVGESILGVYVDDNFAIGEEEALEDTIKELSQDFNLVVNQNADEYLNCKLEQSKDETLVMSKPDILKRIKNRFGEKVKGIIEHATPSTPNYKTYKVREDWKKLSEEEQKEFQGGVGMLLHFVKYTRQELANSTRELSRVIDCANEDHKKEFFRVIKFFLDTEKLKLAIKPLSNN